MRVEVRDASIAFGARRVFDGVSADFESGRITALVGPSGSGKSSLLAAIAGYQPLDTGTIAIRSADGSPTAPSPGLVAWVPQGLNALGSRTALDNVMIASLSAGASLPAATASSVRHLVRVGLGDRIRTQARSLSGGELQRLSIARALASGKPIILADEPSANLDAENTQKVADVLAQLSTHATIIVATHDPVLLNGADAVVDLRAAALSWK